MADLLECLVQIRALRETSRRFETLLQRFPLPLWTRRPAAERWSPAEVVAHMADSELLFGTHLRLLLTVERPPLVEFDGDALAVRAAYADWPPLLALSRFRTRREETVELLERCSAADLERVGNRPGQGTMTVADLVATMLAHDTDRFGDVRERLELAALHEESGLRGTGRREEGKDDG